MDVKNNIITHSNSYNMPESNLSQYGTNISGSEVNNDEILSMNVKSDISSGCFEQSKEKDEYNQKELDSRHKDFGTLMIKIIDDETKEVILEIPPQKILDMVASMCKQVGLLDKKV